MIPEDYSGIGLLGSGVQGFIKGLIDMDEYAERKQDREMKRMEYQAKMNAQNEEKARHDLDKRLEMRGKGFLVPPQGQPMEPDKLEWDPKWVDMQNQFRTAGAEADPHGLKAQQLNNAKLTAENARLQKLIQEQTLIKNKVEAEEKSRRQKVSPVQGYDKTDGYVADPTEERQLRSGATATKNFVGLMDELELKVRNASKAELVNPMSNTSKAINQTLRDLQVAYKNEDFAKLGVLAGPDMKLLEQVIENPGSLSNIVSGKAGVLQRYKELRDRVSTNFDSRVQSYGLLPQQGNGLIKATVKPMGGPKAGDVEDGHQFLGGDPADPKNWKKVK